MNKFKQPKHHSAQMRSLHQNPVRKDRIIRFEHICKYHDAVLFGVSGRGVTLPGTYHIEMKKFLYNYKKEVA